MGELVAPGETALTLMSWRPTSRAIDFVIETFGRSQICVGTDYPFAMGDFTPLQSIAHLDESTRTAITATNAKRFLGVA